MLKTLIIQGTQWLPSEGFAVNLKVAKWLFAFCGWKQGVPNAAELIYRIEEGDWPEGDEYYPCNKTELFILGHCVYMN